MEYVIINTKTDKPVTKYYGVVMYETESGAKCAATRLSKKTNILHQVMPYMDYIEKLRAKPVKMVERTNLMSGEKYMEAEDTPLCCSPASEMYWSM